MKKLALLFALLVLPYAARGQTAQLYYQFTTTASGGFADTSIPPQVDSLNVRINGILTTATWTAQIQTSPDNATWTSCGAVVTATSAASASGGACTPSGAAYARVLVTAGSGGGTLVGALIGNSSLISFSGGGGSTFPATDGVVCNTSTTASVNCSSAQLQTALGSVYLPLAGGAMSGILHTGGGSNSVGDIEVSPGEGITFQTIYAGSIAGAIGTSQPATYNSGLGAYTQPGQFGNPAAAVSWSALILNLSAPQTAVNCSTSGTVTFSQPEQGTSYKKVVAYFAACVGTFSYTFPTAFSHAPQLLSQSITTSAISTISTTAASGTGSTTTGFADLDGF